MTTLQISDEMIKSERQNSLNHPNNNLPSRLFFLGSKVTFFNISHSEITNINN